MRYVRGTKDLPLILSANGTGILKWYVDGSYGVHPNLRGHTGGGLTLGRGFPVSASTKQKLNTRSSTKSELVGVDDFTWKNTHNVGGALKKSISSHRARIEVLPIAVHSFTMKK